jgi:hypothetical protein
MVLTTLVYFQDWFFGRRIAEQLLLEQRYYERRTAA